MLEIPVTLANPEPELYRGLHTVESDVAKVLAVKHCGNPV
jgi:hypothetical protein